MRRLLSMPARDTSGGYRCYRVDLLRRVNFEDFLSVGLLIPVHREIAVNDAHPIIDDFIGLGKIVAADILVDGAAAAQFGEFFDEPG